MSYQISIVEAKPTVLAAVQQRTTFEALGTTIIEALNKVYAFLKTATVRQTGQNVVVYLDCLPTIEAGVQVSAEFSAVDSVVCTRTPGGKAARTVHTGSYSDLPNAHTAVRNWCELNSHELAGPSWEVYGDWSDDPTKLRTEVYYLVKDG